ncbi:hypothetical protein PVAND_009869 [Polypedilum vanderplanki]|uniref:Uncharacterized protein n=1 Tax=Polypedilum vanderplanki TaxID=319348 RepID=A0A9J6CEX2_POLVA|nr:hypothetical protein PVAND_009869 [Polypedilum vanderplanki]
MKKSKCFIISVCVLLIAILLGVITFLIISNVYERHREKCVTRFLYDEGMLHDVMLDEDPMTISNEHCHFVIDIARGNVRNKIKVPCDVSDDKMFMRELENMGLLIEFYEQNDNIPKAREFMVLVGTKVNIKCRGLQNTSEKPFDNLHS